MNDTGILSIVPTPIGNLGDVTVRSIDRLRSVNIVACEDTRVSRRLFDAHGIQPDRILTLNARTEARKSGEILDLLIEGTDIAVVTDAGMPGLNDPGARVISDAIEAGVQIDVLPGPTAHVTALIGSGLNPVPHTFEGFLPHKKGRRTRLEKLAVREETSVLLESPHRLVKLLNELQEHCGPLRRATVARELTKLHQEYRRGTVQELRIEFESRPSVKGECVVIVEGCRDHGRNEKS